MTSPFTNSLILTGPTGSGKSALALELAPLLNAEIIAADSMTLYRGMDIGTAKPTAGDRARVPHHLIDVLDPWESATVAWWLDRATAAVRDIEARGKTALFVGGTPFYLKALLCGLFEAPPVDEGQRRRLEAEAEAGGPHALHARLAAVDPASARRLHPNDVRRVVRALEVWHQTGRPISELQQQSWWDGREPRFRPGACLCLTLPRDELYARIDQRVAAMFASGWINEVLSLRESVYPLSREAGMALGYREIGEYLEGRRSLSETVAEVQLRTRQFAKRQLTWFRGLPGCEPADRKLTFERWVQTMAAGSSRP
ncbi:MAG TPA: tRNA (adenosine(37)-N6)-dimethylallyltransferase MiaA [Gemmataceae bacterium]|nr:tRNA (adenosine(37)-N6)-dimethylallyltransferase MiaA [Gemmataceae bacterium]